MSELILFKTLGIDLIKLILKDFKKSLPIVSVIQCVDLKKKLKVNFASLIAIILANMVAAFIC